MNLTLAPDALAELVEQVAEVTAEKLRGELRPEWLNEDAAAEYVGLAKKALGNRRRAGKVTGHLHGNVYIYERAELDRFARERS